METSRNTSERVKKEPGSSRESGGRLTSSWGGHAKNVAFFPPSVVMSISVSTPPSWYNGGEAEESDGEKIVPDERTRR